jgi:hypothetical protein
MGALFYLLYLAINYQLSIVNYQLTISAKNNFALSPILPTFR